MIKLLVLSLVLPPLSGADLFWSMDFGSPQVSGDFLSSGLVVQNLLVHYSGLTLDLTDPPPGWGAGGANHPWIQGPGFTPGPGFGMELLTRTLPGDIIYSWSVSYQGIGSNFGYFGPVSWFQLEAFSPGWNSSARVLSVLDGKFPEFGGSWTSVDPPYPSSSVPEPRAWTLALGGVILFRLCLGSSPRPGSKSSGSGSESKS